MSRTVSWLVAVLTLVMCMSACGDGKKQSSMPTKEEAAKNMQEAKEALTKGETDDDDSPAGGKVLIVYFSHAGDNYKVGKVKDGNTEIVADIIEDVTDGDEFEIKPEKNYDLSYNQLVKVAQAEQDNDERPNFHGRIADISKYSVVFLGSPVWWGSYPQVVRTFLDKYDLNGKTIIPFVTHEGSGFGNCIEILEKQYPDAKIKGQFEIEGSKVRSSKKQIKAWLAGLGYE